MKGSNIKDIIADIESLNTIVNFGNGKLMDFFEQLKQKEQQLLEINGRDVLNQFTKELRALRGSIQVTGQSLQEWKQKANQHLTHLNECIRGGNTDETPQLSCNLDEVTTDTTTLISNITQQLQDIQQQNNKLESLSQSVQDKKKQLKSNITVADNVVAEYS